MESSLLGNVIGEEKLVGDEEQVGCCDERAFKMTDSEQPSTNAYHPLLLNLQQHTIKWHPQTACGSAAC